jgi:hypothetical protein
MPRIHMMVEIWSGRQDSQPNKSQIHRSVRNLRNPLFLLSASCVAQRMSHSQWHNGCHNCENAKWSSFGRNCCREYLRQRHGKCPSRRFEWGSFDSLYLTNLVRPGLLGFCLPSQLIDFERCHDRSVSIKSRCRHNSKAVICHWEQVTRPDS